MAPLETGSMAPDFSLLDQDGNTVSLADFRARKLLLYFYPRANTPGCTTQSCDVRDNLAPLRKLDVAVVGISPDTPEAQKKFDDKFSLGFPLLADTEKQVAGAYGTKAMGIVRSSFLIDEEGRILGAWYKVKPLDTVPKAMEVLGG